MCRPYLDSMCWRSFLSPRYSARCWLRFVGSSCICRGGPSLFLAQSMAWVDSTQITSRSHPAKSWWAALPLDLVIASCLRCSILSSYSIGLCILFFAMVRSSGWPPRPGWPRSSFVGSASTCASSYGRQSCPIF